MTTQDLQQIQSLVSGAKKVLVLTHKNPTLDTMASALAIYLSAVKSGKEATIAMESEPLVEIANLVGIDKVETKLSGKNFVITLGNYKSGDVEKVSAAEDLDHGKFNLTLVPKEGVSIAASDISFSSAGAGGYDLIYTVEVVSPENLGALYDAELFANTPIINIDNHDENKDYGRFNLVEPDAASISEITTFFLRAIGVTLDEDTAGNLYKGLTAATNKFQSQKINAATFEAAAICLRSGVNKPEEKPAAQAPRPQPQQTQIKPQAQAPHPAEPMQTQPKPQGQPNGQSVDKQPASNVPSDWLGPKIYRGGGGSSL